MSDATLAGTGGYEIFSLAFEAMVGLDPELRQDVLFVIDESERLGRPLHDMEFPSRVLESFMLPSAMSLELKNDIMNRAITEYSDRSSWDRKFDLLMVYRDREGNCMVPRNHKEDGENLGTWLSTQRAYKKAGVLDMIRKKQLEEVGVVWDVLADQWEKMFALLNDFKKREGHCNVPRSHKEDGENLGMWLRTQRKAKKAGKLDQIRKKQLEEVGVVWDVSSDRWEKMFALLNEFKKREGHCNVPDSHKEDGENLGVWLSTQRKAKKAGKLDMIRKKQLEEVGVVWDMYSHRWEKMFALLNNFKKREGHCNVPRSHKEDGENLGLWLSRQRKAKKAGKLDTIRKKQLEEVGVVWDVLLIDGKRCLHSSMILRNGRGTAMFHAVTKRTGRI